MQQTFNRLDGLYIGERCHLIYSIIKDQLRKQSAMEIEKNEQRKQARNKRKEVTFKPSPKEACFVKKFPE